MKETGMKLFVGEVGGQPDSILQRSIQRVGSLFHELVDSAEEAELIITDSPASALAMLKENEEATVIFFIVPGEKYTLNGARSLEKNFPGRVVACRMFDFELEPGDELLVPYLLKKGGKEEK
jgi:hypothetical protein